MSRRTSQACIFLLFLVLSTANELSAGGAWTREPDDYYVKIGATWLTADQEFDLGGSVRPLFTDTTVALNGSYGVTELGFYLEYGITSWLTGIASTQYKVAVREARLARIERDTAISSSGLGDLWLAGRVRLADGDSGPAASLTLAAKAPTGSPQQQIPLGSGRLDYQIDGAVGSSFKVGEETWGWLQGSLGYRLRNGVANEGLYDVEVGLDVGSGIVFATRIDGIVSTADFTEGASDPDQASAAIRFAHSSSYSRWSTQVIYTSSPGLHLNLGYAGLFDGKNIVDTHGLSLGVAWTRVD